VPRKSLAWHPHQPRLAALDDQGHLQVINHPPTTAGDAATAAVVLDRWEQAGAAAVEWRPLAASAVAVACVKGVGLWSVRPPQGRAPSQPAAALDLASRWRLSLIQHAGHTNVTVRSLPPPFLRERSPPPVCRRWSVGCDPST